MTVAEAVFTFIIGYSSCVVAQIVFAWWMRRDPRRGPSQRDYFRPCRDCSNAPPRDDGRAEMAAEADAVEEAIAMLDVKERMRVEQDGRVRTPVRITMRAT